jgi:hypothetical protein
MISQLGIKRCPIPDNFGKKGSWVVLAVFGAWNDLFWLQGDELSFTSRMYGRLRSPTYR